MKVKSILFILLLLLSFAFLASSSKAFAQLDGYQRVPSDIDSSHYNNNCDAGLSDPNEDDWSCQNDMTIRHTWQSYPFGRAIGKEKEQTYSCPTFQGVQSKCRTYDDPNTVSFPGGNGVCAACFISIKDCGSLPKEACETSQGQKCFWYTGYKTEEPKCIENNGNVCKRTDGALCNGGHCYADQACIDNTYCANPCSGVGSCAFQCGGFSPSAPSGGGTTPDITKAPSGGGNTGGGGSTGGGGTTPAAPTDGFCANDQRGNTKPLTPSCTINNTTTDGSANAYCVKTYGGSAQYFYKCTSSGGSNPGSGSGPATGPCAGARGGVKSYVGPLCGTKTWTEPEARAGTFCSLNYKDQYLCNDGKTEDVEVPIADQNYNGKSTCAQTPWCLKNTTTIPTDTPNCRTQGVTCGGVITCCESQNLECKNFGTSAIKTCQYINGTPFTPTPGIPNPASSSCTFGQAVAGCACPHGGGCGVGMGCYPASDNTGVKTIDNPTGAYCSPTGTPWCQKKATPADVATCNTGSAYTPTEAPKDLGYQADCPNVNTDGSNNACVLSTTCPAGYTQNSVGIGGTNGNKACTEFEGGRASVCCRRAAGSNPAPTIGSAPTPVSSSGSSPGTAPSTGGSDTAGCPSDGKNVCKPTACSGFGLQQNNGVGANSACQNVNPSTGVPYGQYCCK